MAALIGHFSAARFFLSGKSGGRQRTSHHGHAGNQECKHQNTEFGSTPHFQPL